MGARSDKQRESKNDSWQDGEQACWICSCDSLPVATNVFMGLFIVDYSIASREQGILKGGNSICQIDHSVILEHQVTANGFVLVLVEGAPRKHPFSTK